MKNTIKKGDNPGIILELLLSDNIVILSEPEKKEVVKKKYSEYFGKIFVITHNPLVTNWSDNVVKIRKEENISFVSQ